MPQVVCCPRCQRKSRVPDDLVGKKVKCPGCAEIFTADRAAAPKPPEPARKQADEDEGGTYDVVGEKKRRRRSDDDDDEGVSDKPIRRRRSDDDDDDDDDERVTSRRRRFSRDDEDEDEDDEDRPRSSSRRRGHEVANWPSVHRGLTMFLVSTIIAIAGPLLWIIGALLAAAAGSPAAAMVVGIILLVALFASFVCWVVGHVFCLPSPAEQGAKTLAVVSISLIGAAFLLMIISVLIGLGSLAAGLKANNPEALVAGLMGSRALSVLGFFCWVGYIVVYFFYLRSLALVTQAYGVARSIVAYLITAVTAPVVIVLINCIICGVMFGASIGAMQKAANAAQQNNQQAPEMGGALAAMGAGAVICYGLWVIFYLAMMIWYVTILVQTRSAVATRLR